MIKSMTAFASAEAASEALSIGVEIRSYNSRYLDLVLRIPAACAAMEEKIRGRVGEAIARGRVELKLQVSEQAEEVDLFEVNIRRAAAYHKALVALGRELNISSPVTLDMLTGVGDVIRPIEREKDAEKLWPHIDACLGRALSDLEVMRRKEGRFIARDIDRRVATIEHHLKQIESASRGLPEAYRERLQERILALTGGVVEIDANRIAQEAAILADRSDITEEIVRAASHIAQFKAIMQADEPAGRKLNFMLQELNREFNTIGSKTEKSTIAHAVVDVKAELEKIREQVQNVE